MSLEQRRNAAHLAGAAAGIAGLLAFLAVHHLLIQPIWFIAPVGLVVAGFGGVAMGAAYAELQAHLPARPWRAPAVAGLVGLVLTPSFVLAELRGPVFEMNASGTAALLVPEAQVLQAFVLDLLVTSGLAGALVGAIVARTRRAAATMAIAGVAFGLGPGHNIPLIGATAGVPKELLLVGAILAAASVTLVEVDAWLTRAQRIEA